MVGCGWIIQVCLRYKGNYVLMNEWRFDFVKAKLSLNGSASSLDTIKLSSLYFNEIEVDSPSIYQMDNSGEVSSTGSNSIDSEQLLWRLEEDESLPKSLFSVKTEEDMKVLFLGNTWFPIMDVAERLVDDNLHLLSSGVKKIREESIQFEDDFSLNQEAREVLENIRSEKIMRALKNHLKKHDYYNNDGRSTEYPFSEEILEFMLLRMFYQGDSRTTNA